MSQVGVQQHYLSIVRLPIRLPCSKAEAVDGVHMTRGNQNHDLRLRKTERSVSNESCDIICKSVQELVITKVS